MKPSEVADLIQSAREGLVIEIDSLVVLGRSVDERVTAVRGILGRGACIKVGSVTVKPEDEAVLVLGMRSLRKHIPRKKARAMGGWNRVPDEEREPHKAAWMNKKLTTEEVEEITGKHRSTLRSWFGPRNKPAGRPAKT